MPKSKVRKKPVYTPPPVADAARRRGPSHPAYPAIAAGVGVVGLLWIAVYYLTNDTIPVIADLGQWNMLLGFGLIIVSLLMMMKWR